MHNKGEKVGHPNEQNNKKKKKYIQKSISGCEYQNVIHKLKEILE